MTAIATPSDVRDVTGLAPEEADDNKLQIYIDKAYRRFVNDIGIKTVDNVLTGLIDSSNTIFYTSYTPIADIDADGSASTLDITVYSWGTAGSIDTRTLLTVTGLDPKYGKVTVSTPPASGIEQLTASYYYYPRQIPEELIVDAVSFLAGYYYVLQEFLLIPEKLSHGSYRWTHVKPYLPLWEEYSRIKSAIVAKLAYKDEHDDVVQLREEVE